MIPGSNWSNFCCYRLFKKLDDTHTSLKKSYDVGEHIHTSQNIYMSDTEVLELKDHALKITRALLKLRDEWI